MSYAGGSGTEEDPYQISTCDHIKNIEDDSDSYFILINDIDCEGDNVFPLFDDGEDSFGGGLDGDNYVIKNIDSNPEADVTNRGILFGSVGDGFEIVDIGFENISVDTPQNQSYSILIGTAEGDTLIEGVDIVDAVFETPFDNNYSIIINDVGGEAVIKHILIENTDLISKEESFSTVSGIVAGGESVDVSNVVLDNVHLHSNGEASFLATTLGTDTTYSDIRVRDSTIIAGDDTGRLGAIACGDAPGSVAEQVVIENTVLESNEDLTYLRFPGDGEYREISLTNNTYKGTPDRVMFSESFNDEEVYDLKIEGVTWEITSEPSKSGVVAVDNDDSLYRNVLVAEIDENYEFTENDDVIDPDIDFEGIYYDTETTSIDNTVATGLTTAEMQGDDAETNMPEFDFEVIWATRDNDYPALQFTIGPEPFFEVLIDSTNSPVVQGNTLEVDFTVNNTGEEDGEQDIELEFDEEFNVVDTEADFFVAEGGTESGQLTYSVPSEQDPDDYSIWVRSEDDSATDTVTVEVATGTISGSVTVLGDPLEDAEIYIVDSETNEVIEKVTTDENGEFTSSDIETGKTVHVTAQNPANESHSDESKPFIEIEET